MPGYSPEPYGDWRDMTIGEALHWLKLRLISALLALGLIEDYGEEGINGTDTRRVPREDES
jgi:hypothetical protein